MLLRSPHTLRTESPSITMDHFGRNEKVVCNGTSLSNFPCSPENDMVSIFAQMLIGVSRIGDPFSLGKNTKKNNESQSLRQLL